MKNRKSMICVVFLFIFLVVYSLPNYVFSYGAANYLQEQQQEQKDKEKAAENKEKSNKEKKKMTAEEIKQYCTQYENEIKDENTKVLQAWVDTIEKEINSLPTAGTGQDVSANREIVSGYDKLINQIVDASGRES